MEILSDQTPDMLAMPRFDDGAIDITVTAMYHAACDMLEGCCPRAAAVLEEAEPDALTYLDFPPTHWKRLRTNNVQERTNREIKRRSRVVQVFPPRARWCGSRARSCASRTRCGRSPGTSRKRG